MSKKGTAVFLDFGGDILIGQTSLDYNLAREMIETSNKSDGDESSFAAGRKSGTIAVEGILDTTPDNSNWLLALTAYNAGTTIACTITNYDDADGTTGTSGDTMLSSSALVSELDLSFPDNDVNTFSLTLQITGTTAAASTNA